MAALAITLLALLTLASALLANTLLISPDNSIKTPLLVQAPVALSPWHGPQENDGSWQPRFLGANGFIEQRYTLHEQVVTLYIAGHCTTNPLMAKLLSVWARVMHRGSVSGVVAFASEYNEESEAAHQTLKQFLPDFYESIASTLAPVPS